MMKILIVNKFYYSRGGDCVYSIMLERMLNENGHHTAFFAMNYSENFKSSYSEFFPTEVSYSSFDIQNIFNSVSRPLFSIEVAKKFKKILKTFKPDIVHLNNIHTHLSPLIAKIAKEANIPVVWTLHDYKLICPSYSCLYKGKVCELCFKEKKYVIKNKCLKDSFFASLLAYLEAVVWDMEKLESYVNYFICPSCFIKNKMVEAGFNEEKLLILHNFIQTEKIIENNESIKKYYCYVGRISEEKGIKTILQAASKLDYNLKIIGTGPLEDDLKMKYADFQNIEFLGYKKWDDFKVLLAESSFLVCPSECYENNPLSVIETLCLGVPVLASKIGGIPELINENVNGKLFQAGNIDDLKRNIRLMFENSNSFNRKKIRTDSISKFSEKKYYHNLLLIYESLFK